MKPQRNPVNLLANRSRRIRTHATALRTNAMDGGKEVRDGFTDELSSTDAKKGSVWKDGSNGSTESWDGSNGPETDVLTEGPSYTLAHSGGNASGDKALPSTGPEHSSVGQNESNAKHDDEHPGNTAAAAIPVRNGGINYPRDFLGNRLCGFPPEDATESWPISEDLFQVYCSIFPHVRRTDALAVLEELRDSYAPDKLAELGLTVFRAEFVKRCKEFACL